MRTRFSDQTPRVRCCGSGHGNGGTRAIGRAGPVGFGGGGAGISICRGASCDVLCLHAKNLVVSLTVPNAPHRDRTVCGRTEGSWLLWLTALLDPAGCTRIQHAI